MASNCTEILVWHTMTAAPEPVELHNLGEKEAREFPNLPRLLDALAAAGMARIMGE